MKSKLLILFALTLPALAQTPPLVVLTRYQCNAPTFDAQGVPASAFVQGFFGYYSANLVTGEQVLTPCGEADFDLIAQGTQTVTAAGVTCTLAQLAALNGQACEDQWNKQVAQAKAAKAAAPTPKGP